MDIIIPEGYYVYGYSDPESFDVYFYIGKGKGSRAWHHLRKNYLQKSTRFYCKLRSMLLAKIQPEIIIIQANLTEEKALELEIKLIKEYGRLDNGGCLYNHTDGGETVTGYRHSEETKEQIRQSCLLYSHGTNTALENWTGRKHDIDSRIKISNIRLSFSKEIKERLALLVKLEKGHPICRFNLETKEILQTFLSVKEVVKFSYTPSIVMEVINGLRKEYKSYGWRYLNRQEIEEIIKELKI